MILQSFRSNSWDFFRYVTTKCTITVSRWINGPTLRTSNRIHCKYSTTCICFLEIEVLQTEQLFVRAWLIETWLHLGHSNIRQFGVISNTRSTNSHTECRFAWCARSFQDRIRGYSLVIISLWVVQFTPCNHGPIITIEASYKDTPTFVFFFSKKLCCTTTHSITFSFVQGA